MTEPDLASRQADVVKYLISNAPLPEGFDPTGLELAAQTLVRKRFSAVRRHYPFLYAGLKVAGPDDPLTPFTQWAHERRASGDLPAGGTGDGLYFAEWLDNQGRLPRVAFNEYAVAHLMRRRWWAITVVRIKTAPREIALAVGRPQKFRLYWRPRRGVRR